MPDVVQLEQGLALGESSYIWLNDPTTPLLTLELVSHTFRLPYDTGSMPPLFRSGN